MQSLLILGRQPYLGLAELESLYGEAKLKTVGEGAVIVDVDPCLLAFDRLGGSMKFCKILTTLSTTNWGEIEKFLIKVSPEQVKSMPEGKMRLGLSLYGINKSIHEILTTGLHLKKVIQKTGRSVRFIPNKASELNSAQVLHNNLTGPNGWDLVFVRDGDSTIVAQTVKVQDISSYTRRDRNRPKRDARVGMLPPKLAQMIVNLAVGELGLEQLKSICDIPQDQIVPIPTLNQTILDPFCGSGVIIQEALLMGYRAYATDLEPKMVDYSKANIDWLKENFPVTDNDTIFEQADATSYKWPASFNFVASETYLGRPFTSQPTSEELAKTMSDCNLIIKKFLQNIHAQLSPGIRLCLAVPAWQTRPGEYKHLPLIDQISALGYNQVSFKHAGEALMYSRADQIVARELIVITRK